jgi:hypothetical protein
MSRKFLTSIDLVQNQLLNKVEQNLAAPPSTPRLGQTYFDTTLNLFGVCTQITPGYVWAYASAYSITNAPADNTITIGGTSTNPTIKVAKTLDHTYITDFTSSATSAASAAIALTTLNGLLAPTAALSVGFQQITNLADPTTAQGAATKNYVDGVAQGLTAKPSVASLSSSNVALTGLQTLDTVPGAANQRVLLIGQTTPSQNGLWQQQTGAWTRPPDYASGSAQQGTYVFVEGGANNNSTGWTLVGTAVTTVDTTAETWAQFTGAGDIAVTAPILKTGNSLSLSATATRPYIGATGKYVGTIGNGAATSFTVNHALAATGGWVTCQVYDSSSLAQVDCDVTIVDINNLTVSFSVAPAVNAYTVVVVG